LAGLKQGVSFMSVGRGTVIDEAALTLAVNEGRIGFAALDVFQEEPLSQQSTLWAADNVLVSPHTAALNPAEDRLIAELFAENVRRYLDGEQLLNRVDTVEFY
jgi:phosphoglycerate dehydrogenase-like enzyme